MVGYPSHPYGVWPKQKLKYSNMKSLLLSVSLIFVAANCYAIPSSYGTATHHTTYWQELATYDDSNSLVDPFGVFWSIDDGATWGRESLNVGDTVKFKFNMHKEHVGTHYADHLKVWVDWDKSGDFDAADVVLYGEELLPTGGDAGTHLAPAPGEANFSFVSSGFAIDSSHIGSLWLRARVTCSESLTNGLRNSWSDQWEEPFVSTYSDLFSPTGHLHQGEVEEWKIAVPDSGSTLALFGAALCVLGFLKRRKTV